MAAGDRRWEGNSALAGVQKQTADREAHPRALKLPLPLPLLLLDGAGAVLIGLGAGEHFGKVPLLSRLLDVPDIALIAMVVGGVMMGIAVTGIVMTVIRRNAAR
jgi:hypothetical protein